MHLRLPACALALLALLPPPARAQGWECYGGNPGRNGLAPVLGPTAADLAWSNADDFSIIAWHPFVQGERVFVVRESGFPQSGGAANDALVALELESGAEAWRVTLPFGGDTDSEWIAWIGGARDGRVYASRSAHQKPRPLLALDAATGATLWSSVAPTQAWAHDGIVFAPDGDPIVGDFEKVVRIDAATGATVWSARRSCPVSGNCGVAATAQAVYLDEPAPGGHLVTRLDLASGARMHSSPVMPGFTAQNAPFLSPDGGTVYFARSQNNPPVDVLYAFRDDGAALTLLWSRPVRWTTSHEHGIGPDGSLYTFTQDDQLVRLDPASGAILASSGVLAPLGSPNLSPKTAVDAEGRVYVGNGWASSPATEGRLWAFPPDLSAPLFVLTLDRPNAGGPALASDGTMVVADRVGVRAYRSEHPIGTPYCISTPTSLGAPSTISASGSVQLAAGILELVADQVPDQPGLFYFGPSQLQLPFGNGFRCVGGALVRLPVGAARGGLLVRAVDFDSPAGQALSAGSWNFQAWFRDPLAGGASFNLSDGLALTLR